MPNNFKSLGTRKPKGLYQLRLSMPNLDGFGWIMVFNATFNNISVISWRSFLLVEESGVPG
jgi:hypothetical protein